MRDGREDDLRGNDDRPARMSADEANAKQMITDTAGRLFESKTEKGMIKGHNH